jgi:hypothetical protein
VAPLMVRALSMYKMTPGESLDGTVLAHEAPHDTEVAQRIKDVTTMDDLDFVFLILGASRDVAGRGFH